MFFVEYDPERPQDHGQFHVRLVTSSVEEMGDPRRSQQVGYWCDRAHLSYFLAAIESAFKRDDDARWKNERAAERERLASELDTLAGNRAPHLSAEENRIWSLACVYIADRIRYPERYSGCATAQKAPFSCDDATVTEEDS